MYRSLTTLLILHTIGTIIMGGWVPWLGVVLDVTITMILGGASAS